MDKSEIIENICVGCDGAIPVNNAMLTRVLPGGGFEFRHLGCAPSKGVLHLYSVEHDCAEYWVIAISGPRACALVEEQDDSCLGLDAPVTKELGEKDVEGTIFAIESESSGTCPMWLAYLIARNGGEKILACRQVGAYDSLMRRRKTAAPSPAYGRKDDEKIVRD